MNIVGLILAIFVCLSCVQAQELTFEQFISSTPQTYGILTIVRQSDQQRINAVKQSLSHYINMQCNNFNEYVVVWQPTVKPDELLKTDYKNSLRTVLFVENQLHRNKTSQRFYLHQKSSQKIYLSLDIGLNIQCNDLTHDFKKWQQHSIGALGQVMTYMPKAQDFTGVYYSGNGNPFSYHDVQNQFFSIALSGASWISTHYLKLMTVTKLPDISYIVQRGDNTLGCEDIGLNFVISHFYPELIYYQLPNKIIMEADRFKNYLSSPQVLACATDYTDYLLYSPIRIFYRSSSPQVHDPYTIQINKHTVYLKYKYYQNILALYEGKQSIFTKNDLKYIQQNSKTNQAYYLIIRQIIYTVCYLLTIIAGYLTGGFFIKIIFDCVANWIPQKCKSAILNNQYFISLTQVL